MRIVSVLSLVVLLASVAAPAAAQTAPQQTPAGQTQTPDVAPLGPEVGGVSLTPFFQVGFGGDYENSPAGFGAALSYGFNSRIALEGEFALTPDADQGFEGEVDASVWSLTGNVLYHFRAEDFTPYLAVGLGILSASTDADEVANVEDDTSTNFGWNWGGGIKAAVSERFGVRADLRYFAGDDLAPDHWRLYGGVVLRRLFR